MASCDHSMVPCITTALSIYAACLLLGSLTTFRLKAYIFVLACTEKPQDRGRLKACNIAGG
ncbi:hypothetical protein ARMSODRAFT_967274, partial [Armillaria solidipes]